jgi:hypothetical protein
MHASTVAPSDDASPQSSFADTLYHKAALWLAEVWPSPMAVPDSGMKPATIGSAVHAYE